ncbi:MAG: FAD-dependent oxidoreductase, partial [Chloroflexi bacterium]|nr:FAD-dependent oxidoreductase [Chloroflexota bacterium]
REIEEGLEIARRFEAAGVSALEIDGGCHEVYYWCIPPTSQPRGCLVDLAEKVKKVVNIPVITVGKLGYPELAEKVLQEGKADFIALGRPLLADPDWANKVKAGKPEDVRPCIGCLEGCHRRLIEGNYTSCALNPATGMEREFTLGPAERVKTVVVVGGGPGGMEAARVAALRGHKVTLFEKSAALGGNLIPAAVPDFKQEYGDLVKYLSTQLKKLGVEVKLGSEAKAEQIQKMKPDAVFIATGGKPCIPKIPGVERENVITAIDALSGKKKVGETIVIIGGGLVGCEAALYYAQIGKKVTVVEILDGIMRDMYPINRAHILTLLAKTDARILTQTRVMEITGKGVIVADKDGKQSTLDADTVILAIGLEPENRLFEALQDKVPELYAVGDCAGPRKVMSAMWEGFRAARLV